MIYYRMLKVNDPIKIDPVSINNELIDLIYSNSMPTRNLFKGERKIWSFAKSPKVALQWLGPQGKGMYDRLAYYDFHPDDGKLFDLTELKTWVALIDKSNNGLFINNLNYNTSVEAIRSIIPCMRSAWSMARACEEVVFIPSRTIYLNVTKDIASIPRNSASTESVLTELDYSGEVIDRLLKQLSVYQIRPSLKKDLEKLKGA